MQSPKQGKMLFIRDQHFTSFKRLDKEKTLLVSRCLWSPENNVVVVCWRYT